MSFLPRPLEYFLGRRLLGSKGRDAELLTRDASLFASIPQNITVTSPELGPSPAHLTDVHSAVPPRGGKSRFPELEWTITNADGVEVKEYLLICEDADAPFMVPTHGLFYAIPATVTRIRPEDIQLLPPGQTPEYQSQSKPKSQQQKPPSQTDAGAKFLKGGFRLGKLMLNKVYSGPRPPIGHGEHRYFYQVVALREKLDVTKMKAVATRDDVRREMRGKIIGWGEWIGIYETK